MPRATGRLNLPARFGVAAALLAPWLVLSPLQAADGGGDCCAGLEQRVAELESMTARKGNQKVSIQVYGDVNQAVLFWDDGHEQNVYVVNNSYKTSRFGLKGTSKIGAGWSAGYRLEAESRVAYSRTLNQFDDNNFHDPNHNLFVRQSNMYVESETLGKFTLGLQEPPKDNSTKDTHVAGNILDSASQDFFMSQGFFLRSRGVAGSEGLSTIKFIDISRCYSSGSALFDCSTRRNMAVYQTPVWAGFWFNAGYGEDDIWSASARYKKEWGEAWKIGAAAGYEDFTDERIQAGGGGNANFRRDIKEWSGEASIMHKPSGIFAQYAFTSSEDRDSNRNGAGVFTGTDSPDMFSWDVQLGVQRAFNRLGKTTLWGGYTNSQDGIGGAGGPTRRIGAGAIPGVNEVTEITGSEVAKWYLAADQSIEAATMDLYLVYQHITPSVDLVNSDLDSVAAPLDDFDLVFVGARLYF